MGKGPLSKSSNSANMSASVDKCSAEEAKKTTNEKRKWNECVLQQVLTISSAI